MSAGGPRRAALAPAVRPESSGGRPRGPRRFCISSSTARPRARLRPHLRLHRLPSPIPPDLSAPIPDPCPKLPPSPRPGCPPPRLCPLPSLQPRLPLPAALLPYPSRGLCAAPSERARSRTSPSLLLIAPEGSSCRVLPIPAPILPSRLLPAPTSLPVGAPPPTLQVPRTSAVPSCTSSSGCLHTQPRPAPPHPWPKPLPRVQLPFAPCLPTCCCSRRMQRPRSCSSGSTCPPRHPPTQAHPGRAPPGTYRGGSVGGLRSTQCLLGGSRWEAP